MRRETLILLVVACASVVGCSMANRLTFVRPSAERGEVTQIAPTYDVSGSKRGKSPMAANELLTAAVSHYQQGKFAEAEQFAGRALKASPASPDANAVQAMIVEARGKSAEAGGYYLKAVTLAPASGIHANNYGTWLCNNGRAAESLAWFDKALADPTYPTPIAAQTNAGDCAAKAGQPVRAEANWRQALAAEPANIAALSGMAALQFDNGRYMDARAFAERWLALAPTDADGLRLASRIETKLGDNVAAQRYLSRLQANPVVPATTTAPQTQ